jgi:hypothetical protein
MAIAMVAVEEVTEWMASDLAPASATPVRNTPDATRAAPAMRTAVVTDRRRCPTPGASSQTAPPMATDANVMRPPADPLAYSLTRWRHGARSSRTAWTAWSATTHIEPRARDARPAARRDPLTTR